MMKINLLCCSKLRKQIIYKFRRYPLCFRCAADKRLQVFFIPVKGRLFRYKGSFTNISCFTCKYFKQKRCQSSFKICHDFLLKFSYVFFTLILCVLYISYNHIIIYLFVHLHIHSVAYLVCKKCLPKR